MRSSNAQDGGRVPAVAVACSSPSTAMSPLMSSATCAEVTLATSWVATSLPSRSTVSVSATSGISFMRCET